MLGRGAETCSGTSWEQQLSSHVTPPTCRVPVTIVTGFLGAGKTSLLNHLLMAPHGIRLAVLVNDFGAINIDADLISNQEGSVISLENGCICCSLSDGLLAAAIQVLRQPIPPDHILIETSGVSDPIEVANTFADPELQPYAPLDGIITLVDAELGPQLTGSEGELARRQVAAADVVLLNKFDLIEQAEQETARKWVAEISPTARILETVRARAPVELLMNLQGATVLLDNNPLNDVERASTEAAPSFDTEAFEIDVPISLAKLQAALAAMPRTIFRAKGFLFVSDRPENKIILQSTGRRAELTVGEPWGNQVPMNRLVFIGSKGGIDRAAIERIFFGI